MPEDNRFSASRAILVGVIGLGVCIALVVAVALKPTNPSVATVRYGAIKPVHETRTKELTYPVYSVVKDGERFKVVVEPRVFTLTTMATAWVPETREKAEKVPMSWKEAVKLYVVGSFAVLFGIYFLMLILAFGRSLMSNKTPPKFFREHFDKGVGVVCGILCGFLLAPETPQNAQVNVPVPERPVISASADPQQWQSTFEKVIASQQESFLNTLKKLGVEVPKRPDSAMDSVKPVTAIPPGLPPAPAPVAP
jgi:hypothetical protein